MKDTDILILPWFLSMFIIKWNAKFQLEVGENKDVICFLSKFSNLLILPIKTSLRKPGGFSQSIWNILLRCIIELKKKSVVDTVIFSSFSLLTNNDTKWA